MSRFDIFILLLTALAVLLIIVGVLEALHGLRAKQQPRHIRATYGPGYGFLSWGQDEIQWTDVSGT